MFLNLVKVPKLPFPLLPKYFITNSSYVWPEGWPAYESFNIDKYQVINPSTPPPSTHIFRV